MFENRSRQRRKNFILFIVILILFAAFGFGYYLNYSGSDDIGKNTTYNNDSSGYRIPDSIRNPATSGAIIPEVQAQSGEGPETTGEQQANANMDNYITPTTKVLFKTYFTLCGHMLDKAAENIKDLISLTEVDLSESYPDWKVNEFNKQQVILTREIETYCPRHYIISTAANGNIAIYVYDSEGKKVLNAETDTPVSTLPPEDQKKLEYGIVVDSEEELQQKLEGFSE